MTNDLPRHTPEPWSLSDMENGGIVSAPDPNRPGKSFRICDIGPNHRSKKDSDMAEANAHLINAAPALLQALEEMLDLHISAHNHPIHAAARKTIALAKGGK